jgi:hypothetical protein
VAILSISFLFLDFRKDQGHHLNTRTAPEYVEIQIIEKMFISFKVNPLVENLQRELFDVNPLIRIFSFVGVPLLLECLLHSWSFSSHPGFSDLYPSI